MSSFLKVTIVAFVILSVVMTMGATKAEAQTAYNTEMLPDADGWVFEGEDCDGIDGWYGYTVQYTVFQDGTVFFPEGWWYNTFDRASYYYYESYGYQPAGIDNKIFYDYCEMAFLGAGPSDYKTLYEHEQAHARGLDHYEPSPATNPSYYPFFYLTYR